MSNLSEPTLTLITINIECMTSNKKTLLGNLTKTHRCGILCIQETHVDTQQRRPGLEGMRLIIEKSNETYGSAIYARAILLDLSADVTK